MAFGKKASSFNKTNLLLFIRPTIIRSQEDLIRVTSRARNRYEALKNEKSVTEKVLKDLKLSPATDAEVSSKERRTEPGD